MGIFDIFSNSDAQNAAQAQIAGLTNAYAQAQPLFQQGNQALQTNYTAGLQPLQSQFGVGQQGQGQLASLLGFGPQGSQGIQSTLQNLPGYQFALNQGAQNVMRNQAATGALNSGATQADLQAQGQGLASQNYFNYANQLQPFMQSANTNAQNIGNMYAGLGQGLSGNALQQANAAYATQAGIGNAQANADYANLAQSGAIFGGLTSLAGNVLGSRPGSSTGPTIGGSILSALGLSDVRAKRDIEPVGKLYNGLCVYRYRYKGDENYQIGLIAQEVEQVRPDAVKEIDGTKYVNYELAVK
jgi:hypothetical protein